MNHWHRHGSLPNLDSFSKNVPPRGPGIWGLSLRRSCLLYGNAASPVVPWPISWRWWKRVPRGLGPTPSATDAGPGGFTAKVVEQTIKNLRGETYGPFTLNDEKYDELFRTVGLLQSDSSMIVPFTISLKIQTAYLHGGFQEPTGWRGNCRESAGDSRCCFTLSIFTGLVWRSLGGPSKGSPDCVWPRP